LRGGTQTMPFDSTPYPFRSIGMSIVYANLLLLIAYASAHRSCAHGALQKRARMYVHARGRPWTHAWWRCSFMQWSSKVYANYAGTARYCVKLQQKSCNTTTNRDKSSRAQFVHEGTLLSGFATWIIRWITWSTPGEYCASLPTTEEHIFCW